MDFINLVRKYQWCDPATGTFTVRRTAEQYADLLSVHPSQLSRFYAGAFQKPWPILRSFLIVFPFAAGEAAAALREGASNSLADEALDDAAVPHLMSA